MKSTVWGYYEQGIKDDLALCKYIYSLKQHEVFIAGKKPGVVEYTITLSDKFNTTTKCFVSINIYKRISQDSHCYSMLSMVIKRKSNRL